MWLYHSISTPKIRQQLLNILRYSLGCLFGPGCKPSSDGPLGWQTVLWFRSLWTLLSPPPQCWRNWLFFSMTFHHSWLIKFILQLWTHPSVPGMSWKVVRRCRASVTITSSLFLPSVCGGARMLHSCCQEAHHVHAGFVMLPLVTL